MSHDRNSWKPQSPSFTAHRTKSEHRAFSTFQQRHCSINITASAKHTFAFLYSPEEHAVLSKNHQAPFMYVKFSLWSAILQLLKNKVFMNVLFWVFLLNFIAHLQHHTSTTRRAFCKVRQFHVFKHKMWHVCVLLTYKKLSSIDRINHDLTEHVFHFWQVSCPF